MEHASSAKSLVGKLQPNIESLDKEWTFFSFLLLSGFKFVCSCCSYAEPWKSDHFYFFTRLQASITTKSFFMVLRRAGGKPLKSYSVILLVTTVFWSFSLFSLPCSSLRFLCHFPEQRHILINYTACLVNVSLLYLFIFTEQCLPEMRFRAYFTGDLPINHKSKWELIKISLGRITFIDAWHQNFCCRTRQLIRKKKKVDFTDN